MQSLGPPANARSPGRSIQFETALAEALRGPTTESFLLGAAEITGAIAGYAEAIGDIEQAPPGIEEAVDPLLRRDPIGGGFPKLTHLPGNVDAEAPGRPGRPRPPEGEALTAEQKRQLAAQLLRRRSAAVVEATRRPGP